MATRAILRGVDIPFFLKFQTDLLLRLLTTRLPIEVKDLIYRSQIVLRVPMAFQTPAHRQSFLLEDHLHVIHLTMATHAADAAIHMYRMIEISKVRHLMNFYPIDRLPGLPAFANRS